MAQFKFDASKVQPLGEYEVYPEGWYTAFIKSSPIKETKNKDGGYFLFEFQFTEGDFTGGNVSTMINLWNKNETAKDIAFRSLSSICHATGVMQFEDSLALHNIPIKIRLGIREGGLKNDGSGYYPDQNEIKVYKSVSDPTPPTPTRADQQALLARLAERDKSRQSAQSTAPTQAGWTPPNQQAPAAAPAGAPPWGQQQAPAPAPAPTGAPPWAQQQVPNGQQAASGIAQQESAPAPAATGAAPVAPPWLQQGGANPAPWAQQG